MSYGIVVAYQKWLDSRGNPALDAAEEPALDTAEEFKLFARHEISLEEHEVTNVLANGGDFTEIIDPKLPSKKWGGLLTFEHYYEHLIRLESLRLKEEEDLCEAEANLLAAQIHTQPTKEGGLPFFISFGETMGVATFLRMRWNGRLVVGLERAKLFKTGGCSGEISIRHLCHFFCTRARSIGC